MQHRKPTLIRYALSAAIVAALAPTTVLAQEVDTKSPVPAARKDDALTPDYDLGYTGFPTKSAVDLRRIIHEARDNLCAVTCPVLCVQSSGDQVITPDSADVILQGVRSKTKGVLRLENVPHVCTISREGARIAQALGAFFRKAEESERA